MTVAVNADSLATWFLPALTRIPREPALCFELRREDEGHTATLLREGVVMAAVTSSPEPVPGCTVRTLGRMRYLPCAAPEFAARHLDAPLRETVAGAPVVVFDRRDDFQDSFARRLGHGGAGAARHYVPTSEGFVEAVAAGLGWGMVPQPQAEPCCAPAGSSPSRRTSRWTSRCTGSSGSSTPRRWPRWRTRW